MLLEGVKIMIVDDHVGFRQVVSTLLRKEGVGCAECADDQEAVIRYAEFRPDVVLMDMAMERLSGLKATAQIKSRSPAIRNFILTQYEVPDLRDEARLAGACDWLLKEDLTQLPVLHRTLP